MDKQLEFNFYKIPKKNNLITVGAMSCALLLVPCISFLSVKYAFSNPAPQPSEVHLSTVQLKSLISTSLLVPREDKEEDRQEFKKVLNSLYSKNITLFDQNQFKGGMLGYMYDGEKKINIKSGPKESLVEITGLTPEEAATISKDFSPAIYYKNQESYKDTITLKVGFAHPESNASPNKLSNFIEDILIKKSGVSAKELVAVAQKDYFPDAVIENKPDELRLTVDAGALAFKSINLSAPINSKPFVFLHKMKKNEADEIRKNLDLNKYYVSTTPNDDSYNLFVSKKEVLPEIPPLPSLPSSSLLDFKPLTKAQIKEIMTFQERLNAKRY